MAVFYDPVNEAKKIVETYTGSVFHASEVLHPWHPPQSEWKPDEYYKMKVWEIDIPLTSQVYVGMKDGYFYAHELYVDDIEPCECNGGYDTCAALEAFHQDLMCSGCWVKIHSGEVIPFDGSKLDEWRKPYRAKILWAITPATNGEVVKKKILDEIAIIKGSDNIEVIKEAAKRAESTLKQYSGK